MKTPIILLVGKAGSGKDTVASFIAKNHNAVTIAQADPMKRFAQKVFTFSSDQLWGPSECRNAPDKRYDDEHAWWNAERNLENFGEDWIADVLPGLTEQQAKDAYFALHDWFQKVKVDTWGANKTLTCRYVLQTIGTEWGRTFSRNMWVDYATRAALKLLSGGYRYGREFGLDEDSSVTGPNYVVITDGRFRNELVGVLAVGGITVRIDSTSLSAQAQQAGVQNHRSETEQNTVPQHFYDATFANDKSAGMAECERRVDVLMNAIRYHNWFEVK